jgi:hypothetical protein
VVSDQPHNLEPPLNEPQALDDGRLAQSWSGHHIRVADRLNALPGQFDALRNDMLAAIDALRDETIAAIDAAITALENQLTIGVTDGSDAAPGVIGEYLSVQTAPSAIATGVAVNVATLALAAGDYDVQGSVATVPQPATTTSLLLAGISTTTVSVSAPAGGSYVQHASAVGAGQGMVLATGRRRISLATNANVYLVAMVLFGGGAGMEIWGYLGARRVR